ncbi:MAG: hypothetical protein JWN37_838 [Candidatus Nomurabacteria bacterium]|nr:hypothetical protein [Candidatus Nomurabacteria bacterium]
MPEANMKNLFNKIKNKASKGFTRPPSIILSDFIIKSKSPFGLINFSGHKKVGGFILPMTLLVCTIILTISTGISIILTKELYFSKLSRESQLAYYAADSALMCAIMIDDQYTDPDSGIGIFPYNTTATPQTVLDKVNNQRQARNLPSLTLSDIKCATSAIFSGANSSITYEPFNRSNSKGDLESGQKSTFSMKMDLGNGQYRCATVLVYKTSTYRQIVARGFSSCGNETTLPIERAIINTTEVK